ncbi:MAG TPA: hypothetical protein V6D13_18555 [Halomicronema sp.]
MSKRHKSSQFPTGQKTASQLSPTPTNNSTIPSQNLATVPLGTKQPKNVKTNNLESTMVQPEQMSLAAHTHIKKYLETAKKPDMEKEDLNAVLRLSQHLRLFGLLSAVGYVNQQNAQEGKVRERTVPVWGSLIGQLLGQSIDTKNAQQRRELMETIVNMARQEPAQYMQTWRKSLMLAEQWNFWARAYSQE